MRIFHEAIYQALYMNENTMVFYDNTVLSKRYRPVLVERSGNPSRC